MAKITPLTGFEWRMVMDMARGRANTLAAQMVQEEELLAGYERTGKDEMAQHTRQVIIELSHKHDRYKRLALKAGQRKH